MKNNITFICVVNSFSRGVAQQVADKLDLYYADINDFLNFNMVTSAQEVLNVCGPEYLAKLEQEAVNTVASFENTIITVETRFFMSEASRHVLKDGSMIVYLKLDRKVYDKYVESIKDESQKQELENIKVVFDEYDKMCTRSSEIILDVKDLNEKTITKKVLKLINNYFK